MLRRVLFYIGKKEDLDYILSFEKELRKTYSFDVTYLYIKDMSRYELIPPALEGMVIDGSTNYIIQQWEKVEEESIEEIKKYLKDKILEDKFLLREDIASDLLEEELKGYDLLVYPKNDSLDHNIKQVLKHHYKSVILLNRADEYKFDRVLFADNHKERANKSLFAFMNIFGDKKLDIVSVNIDEENMKLRDYFNKSSISINYIKRSGDELSEILKISTDCIIMGDLKYSFLLERLAGKLGLKLLEEADVPIFIG